MLVCHTSMTDKEEKGEEEEVEEEEEEEEEKEGGGGRRTRRKRRRRKRAVPIVSYGSYMLATSFSQPLDYPFEQPSLNSTQGS